MRFRHLGLAVVWLLLPTAQRVAGQGADEAGLVVIPRINSAAYFPYGGAYLDDHLTVDLTVVYERRPYGLILFKSHNLENGRSAVNYLQAGVYRDVLLSNTSGLRLAVGYVFSQTSAFRDPEGSDWFAAAVVSWTVREWLALENTALFLDLTGSPTLVNRLLASASVSNLGVDLYLWERVALEQGSKALSASLGLRLPSVRVGDSASIQATVSYIGYVSRSHPGPAGRDGFVLALALPLTF